MSKMGFEEFKNEVVGRVLDFLPESFRGAEVGLNVVTKPNDIKLTGLTIRKAGSNIAPTIYLEEFYSQIESGDNFSLVMKRIADVRIAHEVEDVDLETILDFNNCKDRILPRLYGSEMNREVCNNRVYTKIEDFVVMYIVDMGVVSDGTMSIPIDSKIIEAWGISIAELHQIAIENQHSRHKGTLKTMFEVMKDLLYPEMLNDMDGDEEMADAMFGQMFSTPGGEMYIISNESNFNGSSMILDSEFMNKVAEKIGGEFYILPSSIHEVIAVPKSEVLDTEYLATMVYEINRSQVAESDRLSDHVYTYTRENGLVRVA